MLKIRQVNEQQINAALQAVQNEQDKIDNKMNDMSKKFSKSLLELDDAVGDNLGYLNDNFVPNTRKINGHELTDDITLTASDVGAATTGDIGNAIGALDVSSVGGSGKYISEISESNGLIIGTASNLSDASVGSAGKWTTARDIKIQDADGTNTGSAVSVDGSGNATLKLPSTIKATLSGNASTATTAQSCAEANLTWGGKNFAGDYGPVDAGIISELGANRYAGIKAGVTVEYSRDTGSTWTSYGVNTQNITNFFTNTYSLYIGKADSTNKATANGTKYQLRITIDHPTASVYTEIKKYCIYVSTNGSNNCTVTIQLALKQSPNTFTDYKTNIPLSGWSGYNIIQTSFVAGNNNNQYQKVRFIFKANGGNTSYTGLNVLSIYAYGGVGWTTPTTLAKSGHLYGISVDSNGNLSGSMNITGTASNANAVAISYLLDKIYPVGSVYMSINHTSPATFLGGTWKEITDGRFLRASGTNASSVPTIAQINAGTGVQAEGLPNITGNIQSTDYSIGSNTGISNSGALKGELFNKKTSSGTSQSASYMSKISFDASLGNSTVPDGASSGKIYGNSSHVTPKNMSVYMWVRTA